MSDKGIIIVVIIVVILAIYSGMGMDPKRANEVELAKAMANLDKAEARYHQALKEHYRLENK